MAMSRFGEERLADYDPIYVPHGIDTTVFRPIGRDIARKKLGVDKDEFWVGMVAANKGAPSRKGFVAAFEAFAQLAAEARERVPVPAHGPCGDVVAGRRRWTRCSRRWGSRRGR